MMEYHIGAMAKHVNLSADTLRYYEKIGLMPKIARNSSGVRVYTDRDASRLKFVKRAQRMNFTLAEISQLLEMRENPQSVRNEVRAMTQQKLLQVEEHLEDLTTLRNEMRLLINLCRGAEDGCPIIEDIDRTV